ncbi:MAG: hypothetical protein IT204_06890 [Fimbriimonadaceae bacterium]|nr:hypothetical protein [Fimbriimonadaceae bacterium]
MFSESSIHFLRTYASDIISRWMELCRTELTADFLAGAAFGSKSLPQLHEQILEAFEQRVYRELNRSIDALIRHPETPSPLDVKVLLACYTKAAFEVFEPRESSLRDAKAIRADLPQMGRVLKQVYSERLCPKLVDIVASSRDDLRERWLRDLPTARISDHFSVLSEEDRATFVDQTLELYEAILRGREQDLVPHPHDPSQGCGLLESWILRQVDYFNPKGFTLLALLRAVEHLPLLLEPLLWRDTAGDAWTYRVSLLLLVDARNTVAHALADAYMDRFSRNFYGEVGIMLHRIKNKLTSVPTTMQMVLAVSGDDKYEQLLDPMVVTLAEAALLGDHDRLTQAVVEAQRGLLAAHAAGAELAPAVAELQAANAALDEFTAEHGATIDNVKMMKLDAGGVEMVLEMLEIVLEGGKQTEELTKDLQLRMNEMYEREPPKRELIPVSELLAAATAEAAVDARAKDIHFLIDDQADSLRILGVRREIGRPFVQVMDNAIKYTPTGGDVTVTLRPDGGDHVVFACKDSGIGIPPGEEELVFSLCERCSNAKDFANGTGTGLYHDRITVMHHNGEMWCESGGIGKGTTMYIRLPLVRETAAVPA